jgi:magnesium-transporting ATPase (P-type)
LGQLKKQELTINRKRNEKEECMDWFKRHVDTVIVLAALFSGFLWINGKFNDVDRRLVRIETVLIMKNIMPSGLVAEVEEK